eukprot:gene8717-biopygen19665
MGGAAAAAGPQMLLRPPAARPPGKNGSGRGPDAGRRIESRETDADRTRAESFPPSKTSADPRSTRRSGGAFAHRGFGGAVKGAAREGCCARAARVWRNGGTALYSIKSKNWDSGGFGASFHGTSQFHCLFLQKKSAPVVLWDFHGTPQDLCQNLEISGFWGGLESPRRLRRQFYNSPAPSAPFCIFWSPLGCGCVMLRSCDVSLCWFGWVW